MPISLRHLVQIGCINSYSEKFRSSTCLQVESSTWEILCATPATRTRLYMVWNWWYIHEILGKPQSIGQFYAFKLARVVLTLPLKALKSTTTSTPLNEYFRATLYWLMSPNLHVFFSLYSSQQWFWLYFKTCQPKFRFHFYQLIIIYQRTIMRVL